MFGLAILFGCVVGFSLGLTGGGTALFGAVPRMARGEVELRTGLLFAIAGMCGAPIGSYLSTLVPENVLLVTRHRAIHRDG